MKNWLIGLQQYRGKVYRIVLLLFAVGILTACGKKAPETLANGAGEEIFTDLAEGAEKQQTFDEESKQNIITVDLGSVQSIGYLRLRWDRTLSPLINSYIISVVQDEAETVLYVSDQAPYLSEEEITLEQSVQAQTIQIIVSGAAVTPELAVYELDPWEQVFASLKPRFEDGRLTTETVPSWLQVSYAGCRPYAILDEHGQVQEILEEKEVHVGFRVSYGEWSKESPDYVLTARPAEMQGDHSQVGDAEASETQTDHQKPAVIPELQEWQGMDGNMSVSPETVIYTEAEYSELAHTMAAEVLEMTGWEWQVEIGGEGSEGDILLQSCQEKSLGEEGYRIEVGDTIMLSAYEEQGMYWASRTLLQMMLYYDSVAEKSAQTSAVKNASRLSEQRVFSDVIVFQKGRIRDYPSYPVRGFEIDVARNSVSLHMLREMAKTLSWYKVNELTVHLNDNAIFAYTEKRDSWDTVFDIYSAYRLESDLMGENGRELTATDFSYSKDDFAAFVKEAQGYGVRIVPEIDTPAHSLAITAAFPEIGIDNKYQADLLNLAKEETIAKVQEIWADALPAFTDCPVVHIGADEYFNSASDYIRFENKMLDVLTEQGKDLRMWGSLSKIRGDGFVTPRDNLELLIWNTDWADPETMYREGFSLINAWNQELYLIPGGGYDYLDAEGLYTSFQPNVFYSEDESRTMELPAYSKQIRGAQLTMWNDLCDELAIGITEYDMFDRLYQALPAYATKCWQPESVMGYDVLKQSMETVGLAPCSDPYDHYRDMFVENDNALLGPPYQMELTLELKMPEGVPEAYTIILDEAVRDGNRYVVYLRNVNGKVGIACEEYEYEWDYEFPIEEKVCLTFLGEKDCISLYVDGELIGTIGSSAPFEDHATFLFPLERINGLLDPLRDLWPPVMKLENEGLLLLHDRTIQ
ncbi:MAG: family 20 glycosylhydrolase [Lachnospiraceae bacterium]|nr:family 20 glycosylhydrolase [Lachnospiraceae bacterium]